MPTYDPCTLSELHVKGFWGDVEKLIKLAEKLDVKVEFIGIHPDPNDRIFTFDERTRNLLYKEKPGRS